MTTLPITRRHFFFGSLAVASACHRRTAVAQHTRVEYVSIVRARAYRDELVDPIRRILLEHRVVVRDQRVVLKPNLVEFHSDTPINTHPVFVSAVADAFQSLGAREVRVAEGPGHRRMTLDMAEAAGYFAAVANFESRFTDLNLDDVSRVPIKQPFSTLKELYLPHTVLGCDLLVSLPKLKTHHWAGATLSMKNLFGTVPGAVYGWPKNPLHWAGIHESIVDLHSLFPKQFCLVDGIEAMEGNGPILGTAKQTGIIIGGAHPPSVDATCCRLMQINPKKVGYLVLAARAQRERVRIEQLGESVAAVSTPFALIPNMSSLRL